MSAPAKRWMKCERGFTLQIFCDLEKSRLLSELVSFYLHSRRVLENVTSREKSTNGGKKWRTTIPYIAP